MTISWRSLAGFFVSASICLSGSAAHALLLDARIGGVFVDSALSMPAAGATVNPQGNVIGYQLNVGEYIRVDVVIENSEADLIDTISATLIYQGDELSYLGASAPSSILSEPGFGGASLGNFGSGMIKPNSPNPPGSPGDVWIQAVSYGGVDGSSGLGPDTISLLFQVSIPQPAGTYFDLTLTAGDVIGGAGSTTFSGALVTPLPEPGTALLFGLGLAGLSLRSRN